MKKHATNSPSGASGWMRCREWASDPIGSKFADWGTAAHEVAEIALKEGTPAVAYIGRLITVGDDHIEVNVEMVECVQTYIDYVRSLPGAFLVEQRLPLVNVTGEVDAYGTADAVVISDTELMVVDLKTGKGVKVDAEENEQLQIYALAALEQFDMIGDFTHVRLAIVQPRLFHISEWTLTVEDLRAFGKTVKRADTVTPGEKQCRWCMKKATCTALAEKVQADIGATFADMLEDLPTMDTQQVSPLGLADKLAAVDLIEDWCKAVRAEADRRLCNGIEVPGFKLVQGRRGARQWKNKEEAEAMLKAMRLKVEQMYDFTLISPTTAEKLAKADEIGPRQWPKLQELIIQPDGKPTVAPASDKRQAIQVGPRAEVFNDLVEA